MRAITFAELQNFINKEYPNGGTLSTECYSQKDGPSEIHFDMVGDESVYPLRVSSLLYGFMVNCETLTSIEIMNMITRDYLVVDYVNGIVNVNDIYHNALKRAMGLVDDLRNELLDVPRDWKTHIIPMSTWVVLNMLGISSSSDNIPEDVIEDEINSLDSYTQFIAIVDAFLASKYAV